MSRVINCFSFIYIFFRRFTPSAIKTITTTAIIEDSSQRVYLRFMVKLFYCNFISSFSHSFLHSFYGSSLMWWRLFALYFFNLFALSHKINTKRIHRNISTNTYTYIHIYLYILSVSCSLLLAAKPSKLIAERF